MGTVVPAGRPLPTGLWDRDLDGDRPIGLRANYDREWVEAAVIRDGPFGLGRFRSWQGERCGMRDVE